MVYRCLSLVEAPRFPSCSAWGTQTFLSPLHPPLGWLPLRLKTSQLSAISASCRSPFSPKFRLPSQTAASSHLPGTFSPVPAGECAHWLTQSMNRVIRAGHFRNPARPHLSPPGSSAPYLLRMQAFQGNGTRHISDMATPRVGASVVNCGFAAA